MSEVDEIIKKVSPFYNKKGKPSIDYKLTYDSTSETLEPIYFWLLDFANQIFDGNVEKLIDNFASSPGSGHFSELQGKASQMQQEASRTLGNVNTILKGILNLLYDLKEFKIRLSHYDESNSSDKSKKEAGILALKQIWMDKVDIQRGQGSLNAMASGNLQFVTLRDAFMIVNSAKDVDKIDLNERVKRILKPRVQEFFEWKKRSEQELRKRFEMERLYLKSQVNSLKLYTKWAKPYLKAAEQLSMNEKLTSDAALVTTFSTVLLQLTIMGSRELDVEDKILDRELPEGFKKKKNLRKYHSIVFIDFRFRGIPNKQGSNYVMGGKADVHFRSYSLNQDEMGLLKEKLGDSDLTDSLKLIQGITEDSLGELKEDIEEFMEDKTTTTNTKPTLFEEITSFFKSPKDLRKEREIKKKKEKFEKIKEAGIAKKDNYAESYLRAVAEADAMNNCFSIYDVYKKAHGMASIPYPGKLEGDNEPDIPRTSVEKLFGMKGKK